MTALLAARVRSLQRRLAGQEPAYGHVDPDTVARMALDDAARELGIVGTLEVRWHDDSSQPLGYIECSSPRVIYLQRALRADTRQLRTVALHEAYHAAMSLKGLCACQGGIDDAEQEHAANQFAMRYA